MSDNPIGKFRGLLRTCANCLEEAMQLDDPECNQFINELEDMRKQVIEIHEFMEYADE